VYTDVLLQREASLADAVALVLTTIGRDDNVLRYESPVCLSLDGRSSNPCNRISR